MSRVTIAMYLAKNVFELSIPPVHARFAVALRAVPGTADTLPRRHGCLRDVPLLRTPTPRARLRRHSPAAGVRKPYRRRKTGR
jgi:hypothetical protein